MLASGATYVARGYTKKIDQLKQIIRGGIDHHGFACIDILQICATFFPMTDYYNAHTFELPVYDRKDFSVACEKAREWDYNKESPIALGVFYQRSFPTFDDRMALQPHQKADRDTAIAEFLTSRR
jgi:2-oxoglutarate ferredoxin oxidoreductase subunit beta